MAYMLPQVVINQLFSEVPLNVIQNQNVLVFGPNYQIMDASDEERKPDLYLGHYNGNTVYTNWPDTASGAKEPRKTETSDGTVTEPITFEEYPGLPSGTVIDTSSVRLVGDNVTIRLTTLESGEGKDGGFWKLDDDKSGDDFDGRIKLKVNVAGADDRVNRNVFRRDIRPGDRIRIEYYADEDGDTVTREFYSTIMEIFETVKDSGNFDGIRIADVLPDEIVEDREIDTEDSNGLRFYDYDVSFVTDLDGWDIPREATPAIGNYQWTAKDDGFVISGDLSAGENLVVNYPEWDGDEKQWHQIISADLYLSYRTLLMGATDTLHTISNNDDVYTVLGDVVPENPLAFGVWKTLQNSADRLVYYMATRGEGADDYQRVLDAATKTDKVYILTPLTQDPDILDNVQAHVDSMSTGQNKLWRIAFINHVTPEYNYLYTRATTTDGIGVFAKFSPYRNSGVRRIVDFVETEYIGDAAVQRPSSQTKCMSQVVPLDFLVVYSDKHLDPYTGDVAPKRYVIDRVLSNTSVRIVIPDDDDLISKLGDEETVRVEVHHAYTYAEQAKAIASVSRSYMDRRVYNTFPTWYRDAKGNTVNGVFMACAAAGLVSSVLPQQPITNVEINGIEDVPVCYEGTFSRAQLNEIAEGGTFIIMQDLPGDRVYVRHQISTEYGSNNLLKSELSVTKNLDSISYYFAEVFRPLIGRYNITPKLLIVIRNMTMGALSVLERDTAVGLIGPQVLVEGTEITNLYQDPVNQDHVYMELKLNLPRPFNVLDLNLEVI